jgi:hypothetical protein
MPYRIASIVSIVCKKASTQIRYIEDPPHEKNDAKNITHIDKLIINHHEKFGIVIPLIIE